MKGSFIFSTTKRFTFFLIKRNVVFIFSTIYEENSVKTIILLIKYKIRKAIRFITKLSYWHIRSSYKYV